jgi:hypothetical protein
MPLQLSTVVDDESCEIGGSRDAEPRSPGSCIGWAAVLPARGAARRARGMQLNPETRLCASARDARRDLGRGQLELPRLVAQRPQVDPLASGVRVAGEQLRAVLRGTHAHLAS